MYFMLDEKCYKLLLDIKKADKFKPLGFSYQFDYLFKFDFVDHCMSDSNYYHITSKGEVALNNYCENKHLLLFNKLISVVTLLIALATLIVTLYQVFKSI